MVSTLLHYPLGRARSPTYTYGLDSVEPVQVYLRRLLDVVAVGVDAQTLIEEHLAVAALVAAHKEYHVVAGGKGGNVGHTVGNLAADGVKAAEGGLGRDMRLDVGYKGMKLVERLGCLRVEVNVAVETEMAGVVEVLYHDGVAISLTHETQDLGMAVLAKDDNLCLGIVVILALDAALELEHHRTSGIDDFYMVALGGGISSRRLAMRTQQHLDIVELRQLAVVYSLQSLQMETLYLHAVVHDITQAVERIAA